MVPRTMASRGYRCMRQVVRFIRAQCVSELVLDRRRIDRPGGFVLAATHVSHLEPAVIACHTRRTVHWLARIEFYRHPLAAAFMRFCGALPVNRTGRSVRTLRRAIELARGGEVVGIFPEGGVVRGADAVFRGGEAKRGACLIAIRAGVPVVPVVVLGTERLNRVPAWLPFRRSRVWVAYGRAIEPPAATTHRRAARFEMAEQMRHEFVRVYQELLGRAGLADAEVP